MASAQEKVSLAASFLWNEWLAPGRKEHSPVHTRLLFQPPRPLVAARANGIDVFRTEWWEAQEAVPHGIMSSITMSSSLSLPPPPVLSGATYLYLAPADVKWDAPRRLLVFFHGNASNIEIMRPLLMWLQLQLNQALPESYHILSVEYDGYTVDTHGAPIIADRIADKTYHVIEHVCRQVLGAQRTSSSVIFMGQSIGTAIASLVVTRYYSPLGFNAAAIGVPPPVLILLSPFTSIRDLARDLAGSVVGSLVRERFDTLDSLRTHLRGWRLVVMHGVADQLIPLRHAQEIHDACLPYNACTLVPLDGDHNQLNWDVIVQVLVRCLA